MRNMFQSQNTIENDVVINLVAGSVLKKRRMLLGLSQNTLGNIVGISKQEVMKCENDKLVSVQDRKLPVLNLILSLFAM